MMTSKEIYITREAENLIRRQVPNFPVISIMGPRQSGKTRLIRKYFPELPYYDFEDLPTRQKASKDINQFVRDHIGGAIFDEFHYIPELTQVLKVVSDELLWEANQRGETAVPSRFIITGSHNYLLDSKIKEGMVGRVANIKLLSLTTSETRSKDPFELMYKGGYPAIYINKIDPQLFFTTYIENYLDREVRTVHGIQDLRSFRKFMEICAFLAGQFFDYQKIGSLLEIDKKTINKWLTLLHSSYIIFFAPPYYKSTIAKFANKDKLYFYDTGLAAALMGVKSSEKIKINDDIRGKLFENLVFSEIWKKSYTQGQYLDPAYFWNVTGEGGYEIDMIMEGMTHLSAIEIKSSDTFDPRWFANMHKHKDLREADKFVVYTGPTMDVEGGRALNFCDLDQLFLS